MTVDIEKLKALALKANELFSDEECKFNPSIVLDLIAEVERLRAELAARCRTEGGDTLIKNLTRWTFDRGMTAEVSKDGQWVAYNDLEVLVERQRAAPADLDFTSFQDQFRKDADAVIDSAIEDRNSAGKD